jgi:hypothetical protein
VLQAIVLSGKGVYGGIAVAIPQNSWTVDREVLQL